MVDFNIAIISDPGQLNVKMSADLRLVKQDLVIVRIIVVWDLKIIRPLVV